MSQTSYHILYPATNWSECPFKGNLTQECARAVLHYIRIKFSVRIDFPTSTAYDFHKRNLFTVCITLVISPPLSFLLLAVFIARRLYYSGGAKRRTVGSSKGCLSNYVI
jgi:hypothetical protein